MLKVRIPKKYKLLKSCCEGVLIEKKEWDNSHVGSVWNLAFPSKSNDVYIASKCLELLSENLLLRSRLTNAGRTYVCDDKQGKPIYEGDLVFCKAITDRPCQGENGWQLQKTKYKTYYIKWIKCKVEWYEEGGDWGCRPVDTSELDELRKEGHEYYEFDLDAITRG